MSVNSALTSSRYLYIFCPLGVFLAKSYEKGSIITIIIIIIIINLVIISKYKTNVILKHILNFFSMLSFVLIVL